MDGIKKTALFLSGLEWKTVDLLLAGLDPEAARAVRREMMSSGGISVQESDRLAAEFLRHAESVGWNGPRKTGGRGVSTDEMYVASNATITTYSPPKRPKGSDVSPRFSEHNFLHASRPFDFLRTLDARNIARELADEHPQIIAAVLSYLPSFKARNVIERLPAEMRQDITRRLADFDEIDSDFLHEIEEKLRERLCESGRSGSVPHGVSQNRQRPERDFKFEDLERLGNSELATLFHDVDLLTAMLSLIGASPVFIQRITQRFSPSDRQRMRLLLEQYGEIDEDCVYRARSSVMEKAELLLREI